jgi:hypothetical protein
MLGKIVNITPGSDYKHSGNPSGMQNDASKNASNSGNFSDSVELSSAIRFLMQIGWNLKKLKHSPGDKIELVFCCSGIEFQTVIDISDPNFPSKFDYVLKKEKLHEDTKKYMEVFLSSVLTSMKNSTKQSSELNELNNFFDALFALVLERKDFLTNFDLNELSNEIENISDDINYINNYLLLFIEKIIETKITLKDPELETDKPVVIHRVNIS